MHEPHTHDVNAGISGLNNEQVAESRLRNGFNETEHKKESSFLTALINTVKEPMFLLLLAATVIYFLSGKWGDGIFMTFAILLVSAISLYQDSRSRKALDALKTLTQPKAKVIRNALTTEIPTKEVVPGDYMIIEEGKLVPADGIIVRSNDFSVNESILTGESFPVAKNEAENEKEVYQGTLVTGGLAICIVSHTGANTKLGKIGKSMEEIEDEKTPLQIQISNFVQKMAVLGIVVFLIVWGINFYHSKLVSDSLLKALTLAMSILPEEIPVAFTTFMALGAWRLMKMGIIVKQTKTVEALGSATDICVDKTGTITENKMTLAKVYLPEAEQIISLDGHADHSLDELIGLAMWSSEPIPFDPMEVALHQVYGSTATDDKRPMYHMIHEYPLSGKPPMMTHIYENATGNRIIAAKGATEAIIAVSDLSDDEKKKITKAAHLLEADGFRVLAVAQTFFEGYVFPQQQQDFKFHLKGLLAFYDPPKKNVHAVFNEFYKAGIDVRIITGDSRATALSIARQIAFKDAEHSVNGEEIMAMGEAELNKTSLSTHVFTRMFPEAKLKIINSLKANKRVVAMTGDGVNDGPALKAAHIGIAMGERGSEIAKRASSLILVHDDLGKMVDAIAMGRKIYSNLKKAIQYIISIHIPIILTVFLPLLLGWKYPNIFTPVHVIFLELIMGPTCSIMYENEPLEKGLMLQKPRPLTTTFFNAKELFTSILQGLMITLGVLSIYSYAVYTGCSEAATRTMVFTALISANIFLTLVNRSFIYSVMSTFAYKNNLVSPIIFTTIALAGYALFINPLLHFFQFERIHAFQVVLSVLIGFISVIWFEVLKWVRRRQIR